MDKLGKKCSACGTLTDHPVFCANCGESLIYSDGRPATTAVRTDAANVVSPEPHVARLECLSQPEFIFQVKDGSSVGRRGDVDVTPLEKSIYISGEHVRIFCREGRWLLEHLSPTNATYVNGIKVLPGQLQQIYDGDKITLANTSFLFREGRK